MRRIRDLQSSSLHQHGHGFTSFIAWPVQLESNSFGRRNRGQNKHELGAGSSEYLRHVAVSRLFLDNVEHIQASWPTMGLKVAQMALLAGADDAGSTMMEENVVSASGTKKLDATEVELQSAIVQLVSHLYEGTAITNISQPTWWFQTLPTSPHRLRASCRRTVEYNPDNGTNVSTTIADSVRGNILCTVVVASVNKVIGVVRRVIDPIGDIVGPLFDILSSTPSCSTKGPRTELVGNHAIVHLVFTTFLLYTIGCHS